MGSLVEDLQRPAAYRRGDGFAVELIVTHISWVFRTPTEVFKVKRPVDFGFLDFRTLDARRRACEAEVALNRRLATGVYRGVVAVRRDASGKHHLGGEGEVVDWAVRMARLPDAARADTLLERGALAADAIDQLADGIARFHADARADAQTARFGAIDVIRGNVMENFAQTRPWIERYLSATEAAGIERFQLGCLATRAEAFAARAAAGRVRDGHGDLRLEHVYLAGCGGVTVIDCIEFNERFRYGDVCADLAFLAMDLAWHGRVDLAERLLARYAREADDYDLYAVADFYESYRAFVRGKVAGMLANDEGAPRDVRERAAHEARRYFLLALAAERRAVIPPRVAAVGGVIASGKSTVADALALELGAAVIDADRTRKRLLGVAPTRAVRDAAWQGAYDAGTTERVYTEVLRRAGVVLASGRPVVLDASFRSREMRTAARDLAASRGLPFHFVECRAPADVCRARLSERAKHRGVSDGRLEIFDEFCARFEPVTELAAEEHLVLDTARPLEASVATLRTRLATWPRESAGGAHVAMWGGTHRTPSGVAVRDGVGGGPGGTKMELDDFLARFRARLGTRDEVEALRLIRGALAAFDELLLDDELSHVRNALPRELSRSLPVHARHGWSSVERFRDQLQHGMGLGRNVAGEVGDVVCRIVADALDADVLARWSRDLPAPVAALFARAPEPSTPEPHVPPPQPAQNTLAGGRPGSAYPLSEARGTRAALPTGRRQRQ